MAKGATFKSTGRKRTQPGRAVIAEHREELIASETLAGEHLTQWQAGETTPVTAALSAAYRQWQSRQRGNRLVFEWPSSQGHVVAGAPTSACK